jgi:multidrug resistance efflux pump
VAGGIFLATAPVSRSIQVVAAVLPAQGISILRAPASGALTQLPPSAGTVVLRGQAIAEFAPNAGAPVELRAPSDGVVLGDPAVPGVAEVAGAVLVRVAPARAVPSVELLLSPSQLATMSPGLPVSLVLGQASVPAVIGTSPGRASGAGVIRAQLGLAGDAVPSVLAGDNPVYVVSATLVTQGQLDGADFTPLTTATVALEHTTALNVVLGRQS